MQIQVTNVTKKPKVFEGTGDMAWGVLHTDKQWYDVFQERQPEKGEVIEADVRVTEKNGRTYRNAYPKPSSKQVEKAREVLTVHPKQSFGEQPPPPHKITAPLTNPEYNKVRTTPYTHSLGDYEKLINRGFEIAATQCVADDAARVSLVAILCIAFGEGKLSIDDLDSKLSTIDSQLDDWPADRDWTDGPPPVAEADSYHREKQLSEMEAAKAMSSKTVPDEDHGETMAAAKARTQALLDKQVDYKTKLGVAIKEYCAKNKLDFQSSKFDVLWKCAGTRSLESMSQENAKSAIVQLGRLS